MIFKESADNIQEASYSVTRQLLGKSKPSKPVIIKPNVVNSSLPPVTTDIRVVEGIINALNESGINDVMIAEGSGSGDTIENFRKLGYSKAGFTLIDLDMEKTVRLTVSDYHVWSEIIIPEILQEKFIISVPVLKEHSMCGVTLSLKNMVGVLSASHYSGYWSYKKSMIHKYNTDGCIADIIRVIQPDWAIVDASIGMKGSHLSGTQVKPPVNLVYGSTDPLEADKFGCNLLEKNWQEIEYIKIIEEDIKMRAGRQLL